MPARGARRRSSRAPRISSRGGPTASWEKPTISRVDGTGTPTAGRSGREDAVVTTIEIRAGVELPARREPIELHTDDGLTLVGELSLPLERDPVATLVCLHPLPTGGGFMDSHVIRKAAARLPALADVAVLRFNFRGVSSPRGTSEGSW